MPKSLIGKRGRKPSIGTATERVKYARRALKAVVSDLLKLQHRLDELDRYYTRLAKEKARVVVVRAPGQPSLRGRGPNVKEVAYDVLKRSKVALPIKTIAARVQAEKGGTPGANFIQNLGAALMKDKRFRRSDRGVYGLK